MTTAPHVTPDLTGKVAVVAGASRGIGATTARAFARVGAIVVLAAVERLVARTIDAYGRLDAAFNNAGGGHMPTPLADIAVADFDQAQRVNLRGVFLCMRREIRAMLRTGGGTIVKRAVNPSDASSANSVSHADASVFLRGYAKTLEWSVRTVTTPAAPTTCVVIVQAMVTPMTTTMPLGIADRRKVT